MAHSLVLGEAGMTPTAVTGSVARWGPLWGARPAPNPAAAVVITVWGPHDANDLEAVKATIRPSFPSRPADAPSEPDYSEPGVLEDIATRAGLEPDTTFDSTWAYVFEDAKTVRRAMVAPAGLALLVGPDREDEVKDEIERGLASYRADDGSYRLQNTFHSLIA